MEETRWSKAKPLSSEEMVRKLVTSSIPASSHLAGMESKLGHTRLAKTTEEEPPRSRGRSMRRSVATLAQAMSCSSVRVVFLRDRAFLICLVPSVCISPFLLVFMAHPLAFGEAMHTAMPGSRVPANSSNVGSPDGFGPDLDRMGGPLQHIGR